MPVVGYDLLPTFCQWAGLPAGALPRGIEGGSIAPLLAAGGRGAVQRPRDELVFHFPHYQHGNPPQSAIRAGDLKLILLYEDGGVRLFDVAKDRDEREDLAPRMPDESRRLRGLLEARLAAIGAQMPAPNPDFDPAAAQPERRRGGGGGGGGRKQTRGKT
jgi:arylsulfatase A-like enzyme